MERQLANRCELVESDKQSIVSKWIDHLPLQRDSESSISNSHRRSRSAPIIGIQGLGSCACAGFSYSHLESGTDLLRRSRKRKRPQRRAQMDDSDGISVGSSSRILANRPILEPTPPSSKRTTRTPSPTRKFLTQLESARPPLKCCQPGNAFGTLPDQVASLRRYLAKDLGKGCIPRGLEVGVLFEHLQRLSCY
jgi:hypothetical protein